MSKLSVNMLNLFLSNLARFLLICFKGLFGLFETLFLYSL
nr:MAG TPA: hypothetical protein [Caudoviricetes sp.]